MTAYKKLVDVAPPPEKINEASAPGVILVQQMDDPSSCQHAFPTEQVRGSPLSVVVVAD